MISTRSCADRLDALVEVLDRGEAHPGHEFVCLGSRSFRMNLTRSHEAAKMKGGMQ